MGQRALVAYQRETGAWDVHYSHWGAVDLALEEPLKDGLQPGQEAGRLDNVPVAHNHLSVEAEPMATVDDPAEIFDEVGGWGYYEALYLVPAIGEVEAYLALSVGRLGEGTEPVNTGVFVRPRAVNGERLSTAVCARWNGWKDVLAKQHRRGDVDRDGVVSELNSLAYENWGKPSRSEDVAAFSPLGKTPERGLVSISAKIVEAEQRAMNPNR